MTAFPPCLTWVFKGGISCLVIGFVGWKLYGERVLLVESFLAIQPEAVVWVLLSLCLLAANLGLEARKWQVMIRLLYPDFRFDRSLIAVLLGISAGIFTPARIGEYAGRLWMLPTAKRLEAGAYTFVSKLCQMAITLAVGGAALEFLNAQFREQVLGFLPIAAWMWDLWRGVAIFSALFLWMLLLAPGIWQPLLSIIPIRQEWFRRLTAATKEVPITRLLEVLGLSLLRFGVFSAQYLCLMKGFGASGSILVSFALIAMIFWINSVIPSVALTEIGIRESVALLVMGGMGIATFTAFSSTFLLYVINLLIPSLLGVLMLYRVRSWK